MLAAFSLEKTLMMRDAANRFQVKRVISPVSVADNTAQVGQIIDMQGYESLTYFFLLGSLADADATFAVLLEEGNDSALADNATVANGDMISETVGTVPLTAAGFQFDSDNQVRKLGYLGSKRYTRVTITPSANSSAALMAVGAILSSAHVGPVVQAAS
jgi:hypothetical protein